MERIGSMNRGGLGGGPRRRTRTWALLYVLEWLGVLAIIALFGGEPVPSVNEAHYMTKAKHYWDPSWCAEDLFLQSAEAHLAFYWVAGWPTQWLSLPAATWLARWTAWGILAIGWVYFSRALLRGRGMALLSAMLFALLIRYTPMSGEWVLGGVEGKVYAYGGVLLGLGCVARGQWRAVWPALGIASAFHVLVGGWAVLAAAFAWLLVGRKRTPLLNMLPWVACGGCLSLLGLVPALALTQNVAPRLTLEANQIYVLERLPHHLVFSSFRPRPIAVHVTLMLLTFGMWVWKFPQRRLRRLLGFGVAASLITTIGISIDLWHTHYDLQVAGARWLKYYWFRLSDATLPMILSVVLLQVSWSSLRWQPLVRWLPVAVVGFLFTVDATRQVVHLVGQPLPPAVTQSWRGLDDEVTRRARFEHWREVCQWVREATDAEAVFVTPRNQQTFKWYAHRAEVVNWKDVPQDAAALLVWRDRMQDVYGTAGFGPLRLSDRSLREMMREYGAEYLLVPTREAERRARLGYPLPFPRLYPEGDASRAFQVYGVSESR